MKKYLMLILIALIAILTLSACTRRGRVGNVEITIGDSEIFSVEEINDAIELVLERFATRSFASCELLELWYDEELSERESKRRINHSIGRFYGMSGENIIVLFSSFETDRRGGEQGFNPNTIYTDWIWILIRDGQDQPWRIEGWGSI